MASPYLDRLKKPAREGINQGLTSPSSSFMTSLLGMPREEFSGRCEEPTDERFIEMIETRRVGPIRVTGLRPR